MQILRSALGLCLLLCPLALAQTTGNLTIAGQNPLSVSGTPVFPCENENSDMYADVTSFSFAFEELLQAFVEYTFNSTLSYVLGPANCSSPQLARTVYELSELCAERSNSTNTTSIAIQYNATALCVEVAADELVTVSVPVDVVVNYTDSTNLLITPPNITDLWLYAPIEVQSANLTLARQEVQSQARALAPEIAAVLEALAVSSSSTSSSSLSASTTFGGTPEQAAARGPVASSSNAMASPSPASPTAAVVNSPSPVAPTPPSPTATQASPVTIPGYGSDGGRQVTVGNLG